MIIFVKNILFIYTTSLNKLRYSIIFVAVLLPGLSLFAQQPVQWKTKEKEVKAVLLPNGWTLSPAGRSLRLGDLPLNIAVSSSKKLMAVTNNGQSVQSIQ